jgi:hypothetical protein
MIFEIDGEPVAAVVTNNTVNDLANLMFSSALIYAGVRDHPEGHDMVVKTLRILPSVSSPQPSRTYRVRTARRVDYEAPQNPHCSCRLHHSGNRFRFGECANHPPALHTQGYR